MMNTTKDKEITRRKFVKTTGTALAGSMMISPAFSAILNSSGAKKRVAMVGTGSRGNSLYGKFLMAEYGDIVEFVGLCDINKGRLEYSKKNIGVDCPVFTDFDEML